MDSHLFRRAFDVAFEEFGDIHVAIAIALDIPNVIGPMQNVEWGHIIPAIFGVYFTPTDGSVTTLESLSDLSEFLAYIAEHPDDFRYTTEGVLHQAFQAGLVAGISTIPRGHDLCPSYDVEDAMATLFHAMFLEETSTHGISEPPAILAQAVVSVFQDIFEPFDGSSFIEGNRCSYTACRKFWEYLGFWVDAYSHPVID